MADPTPTPPSDESAEVGPDSASVNPPGTVEGSNAARGEPAGWLRPVLGLLGLVALVGSGYLAWLGFIGSTAAGCGGDGGCATVLGSRWSQWLGLPVSLPAVSLFLTLLAALVFTDRRIPANVRRVSWNVVWTLGMLAGVAACWFLGLQLIWLQSFCPYCATVHAAALLIATLLLTGYRSPTAPRGKMTVLVLVGFLVLVGGQLALKPPATYEWVAARDVGAAEPFVFGEEEQPLRARLLENQIEIRTTRLPQLGRDDAQETLLLLFDYTCPHCRALQQHLARLIEQDPQRYRVLVVPIALWPTCNPYVESRDESHISACELAKLSLAMWQVCPDQWEPLNRWLVFRDVAPSAVEALEHARSLCESDQLEEVYLGELVERDLQDASQLYGYLRGGLLPKLLFPDELLMGEVKAYSEFESILKERQ